MNNRWVVGSFGALVVVGVALGVLTLLFPPPPQSGIAYSITTSIGAVPIPQNVGGSQGSLVPTPTASGAASGSATATGTVEDTQKQPVDQPARNGAPLAVVDNPPPATAAMLEPKMATAGSVYLITFAPYGLGPSDEAQPQLVIRIISSTPRGTVAKPYQWANTNALVNLAPDSAGKVTKGGEYQAVLTLKDLENLLVPELSQVSAVRTR